MNFACSASSSKHSLHVWNYYLREQTVKDPNRFKDFYLLFIQNGRNQAPFIHAKGTSTGTLDWNLKNYHRITKQGHESGEACGGSPQETQIDGFVKSFP